KASSLTRVMTSRYNHISLSSSPNAEPAFFAVTSGVSDGCRAVRKVKTTANKRLPKNTRRKKALTSLFLSYLIALTLLPQPLPHPTSYSAAAQKGLVRRPVLITGGCSLNTHQSVFLIPRFSLLWRRPAH